jgi:seryl-tRNA synthetase
VFDKKQKFTRKEKAMIDIKLIRKDPKEIEKRLKTKVPETNLSKVLALDEDLRKLQTKAEDLKSKRNQASKEIGQKKAAKQDVSLQMKEMDTIGEEISTLDHQIAALENQRDYELALLPNLPLDLVPVAEEAKDNVCIKTIGTKPEFSFPFKNHVELNEKLFLFDFVRSAKISGSGWVVYTDLGARLEWALLNYMLDVHKKNGFRQIWPPLLVKPEIMFGSGQLPKFENQIYKINDEEYNLFLIPTAEVALNGLHYDEILEEESLPIKYVSYTPCFRREAGAAGKQERGLIRTHQFNKVELFCFSKPNESEQIFDQMMASAEEVLQGLGLHYRNMLLCTGDMSFASAKTIDIEVWLPGQNRYYEVSSVSNCTDYQSRRSKIRFRKRGEKPELLHTLNGSGVATSRLMVALLENNQKEDGSVTLPTVLHKYLENEIGQLTPKGGR